MSISKRFNDKLAVQAAADKNYKFYKNGTVKKRFADGKYRKVGSERHGYNIFIYKGVKLVSARVRLAKGLLDSGYTPTQVEVILSARVIHRLNGRSLDDRSFNTQAVRPEYLPREEGSKRLSQKQIDRMVELFFDGYSVAKIARRFRRKISRSHVSRTIKQELGIQTVGG